MLRLLLIVADRDGLRHLPGWWSLVWRLAVSHLVLYEVLVLVLVLDVLEVLLLLEHHVVVEVLGGGGGGGQGSGRHFKARPHWGAGGRRGQILFMLVK